MIWAFFHEFSETHFIIFSRPLNSLFNDEIRWKRIEFFILKTKVSLKVFFVAILTLKKSAEWMQVRNEYLIWQGTRPLFQFIQCTKYINSVTLLSDSPYAWKTSCWIQILKLQTLDYLRFISSLLLLKKHFRDNVYWQNK